MTREEQVDWLCRLRADLNNGVIFTPWNKEFIEALNDVLEQEPCDNAVSRQAVKEQMIKYGFHAPDMTVTEFVDDLPFVNPQEPKYCDRNICVSNEYNGIDCSECEVTKSQEPKTGHWIQTNEFFINQDEQFIYNFICSECKSLSYFRKSNKKAIGANVCPNCGTKMIESRKSEEV